MIGRSLPEACYRTIIEFCVEALAIVQVSEDDAWDILGRSVFDDVGGQVRARWAAIEGPDETDIVTLRRWAVTETLRLVGRGDNHDDIYTTVFIAWRNRKNGWGDLEDMSLWAPKHRVAA